MDKLTVNQVAAKVGKTSYTIKKWYNWYESLTENEIEYYKEKLKMPELPKYETVGATKWRYWDEEDLPKLKKFNKWVPHTKNGVFNKKRGDSNE